MVFMEWVLVSKEHTLRANCLRNYDKKKLSFGAVLNVKVESLKRVSRVTSLTHMMKTIRPQLEWVSECQKVISKR